MSTRQDQNAHMWGKEKCAQPKILRVIKKTWPVAVGEKLSFTNRICEKNF